eukprot:COSAG02_NODE_80_length_40128_cov_591.169002_12_plen_154_part_00
MTFRSVSPSAATAFYHMRVLYAVPMPNPSSTGAKYFKVTKEFRNVKQSSRVERGEKVQVNHLMSLTGDPRSVILEQDLQAKRQLQRGTVTCVLCTCSCGLVIGFLPLVLVALNRGQSGTILGCTKLWLTFGPIAIILPLILGWYARSANRKQP